MKKPQYITIIISVAALCLLWAFGSILPQKKTSSKTSQAKASAESQDSNIPHQSNSEDILSSSFSIDSAIIFAKNKLPMQNTMRLSKLENELTNTPDARQKIQTYRLLSQYWKDTLRAFIPYAWYKAEGARLENSEKNLNFAGHLFLSNLQQVENSEMMKWMALQAKDLFERSLKLNPDNDSAKVGLGATYMFGGISNAPMTGIAKIREVIEKDSTNVYAQMTLAMGSLISGQADKAKKRLEIVTNLDSKNLQATLMLADIYEKEKNIKEALKYYQKALPLVTNHAEMKTELEKRISALKKQN